LKVKRKILIRLFLGLVGFLIVLPVAWFLADRFEGEKPRIHIEMPTPVIAESLELPISVSDDKSGLRSIWVGLSKDGKEVVLLEKVFPAANRDRMHTLTVNVKIEARQLGLTDGPATIRISVKDYSWRRWWNGNIRYVEKRIIIDTAPPVINVLSRFHNVSQGGAGLAIYRLSEPCRQSGLNVGDNFFPGHAGYFNDDKIFLALFALSTNQDTDTRIYLSATDLGGNRTEIGVPYYIKRKRFEEDTVHLSDKFLNRKMPEINIDSLQSTKLPLINKFIYANRDLRKDNFRKVSVLAKNSAKVIHWQGAFLRLPGSARTSGFGDIRDYKYNGHPVDRQIHLGIDLASVAHSPVPAANHGRVIYTGPLGIYGNTVIIDHGFGLLSTYSHLSRIAVKEQQMISKGEIIGRTGMTGLAGGDHLHFSMFIHNTFVNPVEWWDEVWIENNILAKIKEAKSIWQ
jgi:murein DD-endopeptidase MepM/ murein hydrolase activator NlpD